MSKDDKREKKIKQFLGQSGLGSMSGPLENAEKFNTEITQPLKILPFLMWLSSTSQAHYPAFLKHVIQHFSNTYEALLKHF
jgi:hypothetical protein